MERRFRWPRAAGCEPAPLCKNGLAQARRRRILGESGLGRADGSAADLILRLARPFAADAVEARVPDVASGRALIAHHRPDVLALLQRRRDALLEQFGEPLAAALDRCDDALLLSLARLGVRHGSWGGDFHHYHNENHALEILDGRLGRLMQQQGLGALAGEDWLVLSLFATCHDLRQREIVDYDHPIGNNEAASISETGRILRMCGFDAARDRSLFVALELMIAGSTFDARPAPPVLYYNSAEMVSSGGALAPNLGKLLDQQLPAWREDPDVVHALELALIASDLDTANVGEPFPWLAESASRLCQEREMRSGRSLDSAESAAPCIGFLSDGQERYFFELHKFCSPLGSATFAPVKQANASRVRAIADAMRSRYGENRAAVDGQTVVSEFARLVLADTPA